VKPRLWRDALLVTLRVTLTMVALGRPALAQNFSAEELALRTVERRAVEAVIWGMPAVNFQRMKQAALDAKAGPNQIVYWSRPANWKDQTLTPNPDTIYFNPFYDVTKGPVVLEIPPVEGDRSITGSVDDAWQNALEDVGIAGVDKGEGGKYLILPPGYKQKVPSGYIPLRSDTFNGFVIMRSNLASGSDADIAAAVAYGRRLKLYPLAEAARNPQTQFVDLYDAMFDATIPYDEHFFESLHRFVQAEPWLTRDKAMIDPLKSIGIEKGKPFAPDTKTRAILAAAAQEARAYIDTKYEASLIPPFKEGTRWALPATQELVAGISTFFANPNSYPTDARAAGYSIGYFSAKHLGGGQFYLMTVRDKDGNPMDGGSTYRLTVPANAPVNLYWSATAYDRATHALIRETPRSSRGSNAPGIQKNPDGSVDIWFAPAAPAGKELNWVPTKAGGRFEVMFRFYGPEKPLFEKTWVLPDIEKVN
jgi:hypothetical protein